MWSYCPSFVWELFRMCEEANYERIKLAQKLQQFCTILVICRLKRTCNWSWWNGTGLRKKLRDSTKLFGLSTTGLMLTMLLLSIEYRKLCVIISKMIEDKWIAVKDTIFWLVLYILNVCLKHNAHGTSWSLLISILQNAPKVLTPCLSRSCRKYHILEMKYCCWTVLV